MEIGYIDKIQGQNWILEGEELSKMIGKMMSNLKF